MIFPFSLQKIYEKKSTSHLVYKNKKIKEALTHTDTFSLMQMLVQEEKFVYFFVKIRDGLCDIETQEQFSR